MAEVLVLVEHAEGELKKSTVEALITAARLGEPAAVVVDAPGTTDTLAAALAAAGAAKIYVAESEEAASVLLTPKVDVVAGLAEQGAAAVILTASTDGKEIAARVAARLGSGLLTDVVDIKADGTGVHSVFGGAYTVEAVGAGDTKVFTLRAGSIDEAPTAAAGERIDVEVPAQAENAVRITSVQPNEGGDRPELTDASIVVSGGRGVGSAEKFTEVIEPLADTLGAAVGASRAAVDSGYYPGQFQVGQTGKTVSPQLYLALGISGAIQHRAGMQTSKTIVVVNKDPEAPIFEIADYGIVGDLFDVAPQLQAAVAARK